MENDFSNSAEEVLLEENLFPIDDYNFTNFSLYMIPKRDSLYIVIPMTIIYSLIFVTGVVGNVVTFIVIVRNRYMHTATNYYLFSLAISDLLLLVSGLPQEMVSIWCRYPYFFGEVFCVLRGLSAETSTNASVLTITAFTVERYVAICHPFLAQTMSKLSRAVKLIVVIWFMALSFAIPQAMQFGVVAHDNDPNQTTCTFKRTIIAHSFAISSFLFFVAPMILITVLYALIGIKLRKSNVIQLTGGSSYNSYEHRSVSRRRNWPINHQSSRRVLKMLVAVVVAFFVCWAPFHAQRLVYEYGSNKENKPKKAIMKHIYEVITYISGILYYVSTTINPILYHIMSLKFREAFQDTLARCPCFFPFKSGRRNRSYSILYRYYQRGSLSRRGTYTYDPDNSNFVREDSIPSNCIVVDTSLSLYKCRRKNVSVSEATDDSTRTETTQVSHKPDSPSRGNSQRQFSALVVHLEKSEIQKQTSNKNFWSKTTPKSKKEVWKMLSCIKAESPEVQRISKYCFRAPNLYAPELSCKQKDKITSKEDSTGKPKTNGEVETLCNDISNSSLKECNNDDLREELRINLDEEVTSTGNED